MVAVGWANGSTALYAWVNLGDMPLAVLSGFNTLACLTVIALTLAKRRQDGVVADLLLLPRVRAQ